MTEPIDEIDVLLQESMGGPPPKLPPTFSQQITRRLRPRRLSPGGRRALQLYILAASLVIVPIMRSQGIEWSLIGASLATTAAIGGLLRARFR